MAGESLSRRLLRRVPFAVGLVAILALLNVAVGATYDQVAGRRPAPAPLWSPLGDPAVQGSRWSTPAMAGRSWTSAYAHEISALRYRYQSFLTYDQVDHHGTYVNVTDGIRRSWAAPAARSAPRPVVSINGGNLAFGVGQRDGHTVASELARLAAADGTPIDVRNAGRPGWTTWQSMLGYERDLASRAPPDIALFLGGMEDLTGQPNADGRLSFADLPGLQSAALGTTESEGRWDRVKASYARLSVVHRAARWAGLGSDRSRGAPHPLVLGSAQAAEGASANARAWALVRGLAAQNGVVARSYWQPLLVAEPAAARRAVAHLGPGTVDLSGLAKGHRGEFLDPGDVNEAGARALARRLWVDVRPDVERWYRTHPATGG